MVPFVPITPILEFLVAATAALAPGSITPIMVYQIPSVLLPWPLH